MFIHLAALLLLTASSSSQESILFARTPDISPDGRLIAFSYLGDIWTVEVAGGKARSVTQHQAHDLYPIFSPDGRQIAFASNRHGSYDVFVVSVHGGRPRRLTFDSANDFPCAWSPDGKFILFSSSRNMSFPPDWSLYTVPVEGGTVRAVVGARGRDGSFSPDGRYLAYVRGAGTWYRVGYRGSSNDDIWILDLARGTHRALTNSNSQDLYPSWSPDGKWIYHVSEGFSQWANIVKQSADGKGKPVLVTADEKGKPFHQGPGVRRARLSRNGEWIVYECGTDLWIVSTREGSKPRKLAIEVHADDKVNPERTVNFTSKMTGYALTRDERHVAFVVHGEIFLQSIGDRSPTRRLTDHSANDHGMTWSPDAARLIFISDRDGQDDLYLLESAQTDKPKIFDAHLFKVKRLTSTRESEFGVTFSPDGQRVTFLRNGRLWSMKPDGTDQKVLVDTPQVIDYEWSPDGKWIAYSRVDESFASDLFVIPASGGEARNVTRYASYNAGVTWSGDGKKLCYLSRRKSGLGLYVTDLYKPAVPNAPPANGFDWEDVHHRVTQPTPMAVTEGAINLDGTRVAFASSDDLWVADVSGANVSRVTTGGVQPRQIQWSRRLPTVIYFRDGTGQLRMAHVARPTGGSPAPAGMTAVVPFKARMTIRDAEVFHQMFDQSWRTLADNFYDPRLHGVDWDAVRKRYRPAVAHVALKEDLYSLLYLMMGELNSSHLGVSGPASKAEEETADLGLIFDETYRGRGLRVAEILKRGPADRRGLDLRVGDYVLAIEGEELKEGFNLSKLLNDKVGEPVQLLVSDSPSASLKDPKAIRKVEIKAVSRQTTASLMYDRWVEGNARRVQELSKGRLAYIHIPDMRDNGLDRFVRALYSEAMDKDGLVLDVRFNSGGYTHEQLLNYLGSREHTLFRTRFGGEGLVLNAFDRKWHKPQVLLINERSYSDAEIFPHAFRTHKLGKLVGQTTGGQVIGTRIMRLIDGSTFNMPAIGVFTSNGINMEKEGVKPDVLVVPHPDQLTRGQDPQLVKAVEVLMQDVIAWKKARASARTPQPEFQPMPPADSRTASSNK